jgi:beta-glucanase (GH16 family)
MSKDVSRRRFLEDLAIWGAAGIGILTGLQGTVEGAVMRKRLHPGLHSHGAVPYGVSPPSGKKWTMTFDDEFTQDKSIDTSKWNGGAGGTDWCSLNVHGKPGGTYMFNESSSDPCGQHYEGLTLTSTNGLEMRSTGSPSAAITTSGTTARNAKFIQKFGYWEARMKVPHNTHGEGRGIHSDFWMHPIPEGVKSPTEWLPEINVGERATWDSNLESANNKMSFSVNEKNDQANYGPGTAGAYGDSPLVDLSADWHRYGMYWRDDGSGPYGSIQFYLDGVPLLKSPYTLSSKDTDMANGVYTFLSLDNDQKGGSSDDPFMIEYVRVWRLDPSNRSNP